MSTDHPATPEPDLDRDIHFALRAESIDWHTRHAQPTRLCWPIFGYLRMIALPGGILLFFTLTQLLPGPSPVRIGLYVLAAAIVLVPLFIRGRREKLENERFSPLFARMSDQKHRLRVSGPATKLDRLRTLIGQEPESFEPRILRVGRAGRRGVRDAAIFSAVFVILVIPAWLTAEMYGARVPMLGMILIYAALTLTFLIWSFLWPTYLRFVPGRLDILNYNILGRGRPTVRSFDLSAARILVMIPGSAVLFLSDNPAPAVLDVGPVFDSEPFAFERAILAAARSAAPTPQLPEDALTG